jgi:hypothetical protein
MEEECREDKLHDPCAVRLMAYHSQGRQKMDPSTMRCMHDMGLLDEVSRMQANKLLQIRTVTDLCLSLSTLGSYSPESHGGGADGR